MTNHSYILFKNAYYTACAMRDGSLIVTNNRKQSGKCLTGEQASIWIELIKTALDNNECHNLMKAIYNS